MSTLPNIFFFVFSTDKKNLLNMKSQPLFSLIKWLVCYKKKLFESEYEGWKGVCGFLAHKPKVLKHFVTKVSIKISLCGSSHDIVLIQTTNFQDSGFSFLLNIWSNDQLKFTGPCKFHWIKKKSLNTPNACSHAHCIF